MTETPSAAKKARLGEPTVACDEMIPERVRRFAELIRTCIEKLQPDQSNWPSEKTLEAWARLVVESMSTAGRTYHTMDHVEDVISEMKPEADAIGILAGVFHDVIYLTIDKHLSAKQARVLADVCSDPHDNSGCLDYRIPYKCQLIRMTRSMFEYVLGPVPQPKRRVDETNEFLSAAIAVKVLGKTLSLPHIFQILAAIEASIPFRPIIDGKSPMESLYQRLSHVNTDFDVGLSDDELIETVRLAARFANADLASFRYPITAFLDRTWKLLPEWKPALLKSDCELKTVFQALVNLQDRYKVLNVYRIFQSFRGEPSPAVIEELQSKATENLKIVGVYIAVRLFAVRVLLDYLSTMTAGYETILSQKVHGGAVGLLVKVEEAIAVEDPSIDQLSDPVYQCLRHERSIEVCMGWDAAQTCFSAALYVKVELETIQSSVDVEIGHGKLVERLPESLRNDLALVLTDALPEEYANDILKVIAAVTA